MTPRWRVFDQILGQAREGFDGLTAPDAEGLLDEALSEVRAQGLVSGDKRGVLMLHTHGACRIVTVRQMVGELGLMSR